MALVFVFICVIGAYGVKIATFDVGVMLAFGVFRYAMRRGGFPSAPLIILRAGDSSGIILNRAMSGRVKNMNGGMNGKDGELPWKRESATSITNM